MADPVRMRVKQIKAELDFYGVYYGDCFEKEPLVRRLVQARANGGGSSGNNQQQQKQSGLANSTPRPVENDDFWQSVKAKVEQQAPAMGSADEEFFNCAAQPAPGRTAQAPQREFFSSAQQPTPSRRPQPSRQTRQPSQGDFFGSVNQQQPAPSTAPQQSRQQPPRPTSRAQQPQPTRSREQQQSQQQPAPSRAPQPSQGEVFSSAQQQSRPRKASYRDPRQATGEIFGAAEETRQSTPHPAPQRRQKDSWRPAPQSTQSKPPQQETEGIQMTEGEFWSSVDQTGQSKVPQSRRDDRLWTDDFWKAVKGKVKRQRPGGMGSMGGDFFSSVQQPTPYRAPQSQGQSFGAGGERPSGQSQAPQQETGGTNMTEEEYWRSEGVTTGGGGMIPDGLL